MPTPCATGVPLWSRTLTSACEILRPRRSTRAVAVRSLAVAGATVDLTMHYLAPASASDLTATARVLRRGRKISHAEVSVRDAGGTPVAHGVATYQVG